MQNGNKPLVAIWMVTYNHQNYIEQALKSILDQITNFEIKLFIGEDYSTDATLEIIEKSLSSVSINFEIISNSRNLGPNSNALQIYRKCFESGAKYIALCEGDDYWTDPYKLQKQVDFLELSPNYSMCFHPTYKLKNTEFTLDDLKALDDTINIDYLALKGNFIHTASVLFRNGLIDFTQLINCKAPAADYIINMLLAKYGLIKKLDDPMAVYRIHDGGIWSSLNKRTEYKKMIIQMNLMIPMFSDLPEVTKNLKNQRRKYRRKFMSEYAIFKFLYRVNDSLKYRLGIQRNQK